MMKKEALVLIDIQDVYFTPGPFLLHKPIEAAEKAAILLEKFRNSGKTVVHVKHSMKLHGGIHKLVKPLDGEKIVQKDYPSSFLNTDLQKFLQENQIERVVVAGMMSHMCVSTTVRECQNFGYEVIVVEDACTTKDLVFHGKTIDAETVHASHMAALDKMFANVMSLEEFCEDKN